MDLLTASMSETTQALQSKKISAKELTQFFLERSKKLNPQTNAFITFNDDVLKQAEALDQKIAKGENLGLLAGIPFGIKDLICTKNIKTTAGSKILENFVPPYEATVTSRLLNSGAVFLGKLNLDEFAMGSSNETSHFGPVKNPWNLQTVPGGSSGGSAAAQAARMTMATLGTDTGGSIRQPASFCNIVGLKPTYGRVSRYGVVAYASSLDQVGPMTTTVEDAALTLEVIAGHDQHDATSSTKTVESFSKNLNQNIKGLKIGLIKEFNKLDALHEDVKKTYLESIETLKKLGAEVVEVSIPLVEYSVSIYYLIATSEASSNLARYDGVKYGYRKHFHDLSSIDLDEFYSQTRSEGFGTEIKRRIILGTFCLSSGYFDAYYKKACQVRRLLKNQYDEAFKKCDVLLSPVTTTPAFKIGEQINDPLKMYMNDIFTTSTNLAGLPGMSVPFGFSKDQLPIGVQLTANSFEEQKLLNFGYALQENSSVKNKIATGVK